MITDLGFDESCNFLNQQKNTIDCDFFKMFYLFFQADVIYKLNMTDR